MNERGFDVETGRAAHPSRTRMAWRLGFLGALAAWGLGDLLATSRAAPPVPKEPVAVLVGGSLHGRARGARELRRLPGIGPIRAGRIAAARFGVPPSEGLELLALPGIGPKTVAGLARHLSRPP